MTGDETRPALADRVHAVCPAFKPEGGIARTSKSRLIRGLLAGKAVVAKVIMGNAPVWHWLLAREIALYKHFGTMTPPVRVPRLVAADAAAGVLVMEHLAGRRLAAGRYANQLLKPTKVRILLDALDALASWNPGPMATQPAPDINDVRARMLPDPTAPLGWYRDAIERCRDRSLLSAAAAQWIHRVLDRHPLVAFAHGDLLLRNVLWDADGPAFVDWEDAGMHPACWDLALLWVGLEAGGREIVENRAIALPEPRRELFAAGRLLAVARELYIRRYRLRTPADHPACRLLESDRDALETSCR